MTKNEIRATKRYEILKETTKRHGGFNLVGKYKMTDEQIEQYLIKAIENTEIHLQALKDMLKERDFH